MYTTWNRKTAKEKPEQLYEKSICNLTRERTKIHEAKLLFVDSSKAFNSIHREKMEQIQHTYGLPLETVSAIIKLYKNTKVMVCSLDDDTGVVGVES